MLFKAKDFQESRRHFRIQENLPIHWKLSELNFQGIGRIRNLSLSGMLLETDRIYTRAGECVYDFESFVKGISDFLPSKGRLIWHRPTASGKFLCGIEFIDPEQTVVGQLKTRVEKAMVKMAQLQKVNKVAGLVLMGVLLGLTIYALIIQGNNYQSVVQTNELLTRSNTVLASNYRSYVHQYKVTKTQLDETTARLAVVTQQLDQVTTELNQTRAMYSDSQNMLAEVQKENASLKEEIGNLEALRGAASAAQVDQLNATIAQLKDENLKYAGQIDQLKTEMRELQVNVTTIKEGSTWLGKLRDKIREVKMKMRSLKQQAHFAKVKAQQEHDRIAAEIGNSGYLMKDGKIRASKRLPAEQKTFNIDVKMVN